MVARRFASARRAALAALVLAAAAPGCSGAPPPGPAVEAGATCDAAHLEACERRIAAALSGDGEVPLRRLVVDYVAARATRDAADPWAATFHAIDVPGERRARAILFSASAPAEAALKLAPSLAARRIGAFPVPGALSDDEMMLAIAAAAGYEHVIRAHGDARVTQLFPNDPLAPFVAGLRPIVRDDRTLAHLEGDLAIARSIRAAIEAAGASRYADAAREADRLAASIAGRDPFAEPVLRARFALQLLGAAGIALDPDEGAGEAPPPSTPDAPAPAEANTVYGDYLRVRTARDDRKEWAARGAKILAAIAPDRRDDLASLHARAPRSCAARRPPPMEGARDLVFAARLSAALARDPGGAGASAGQLPLAEWLERYEALVGLVERTRSGWSFAPSLLRERGEAVGLHPAGTPLYRRVTAIGAAHIAATRALEAAFPRRYRAISQLALVTSPGVLLDDALRDPLLQLTRASVEDKVAAATDAEGVFAGVVAGAFAGMSYPPAIQEAHYAALQGAFAAKLRGDLAQKSGWGVAGLYALDAIYRIAADFGPNLASSQAQIARALGGPSVPHPALAALATAAARYAALAADGKLDPRVTAIDRFPADRKAARDALRAAIAGLGAAGEAPNNVLDDVTELADGLVATLSAALAAGARQGDHARPHEGRGRAGGNGATRAGAGKKAPNDACARHSTIELDPVTRRALAKLGDVRQRILSHPRYKSGDGAWVRRVRLLVTLLSDAMDAAQRGDDRRKAGFTISTADAEKNVAGALREWDERAGADALAGAYALARSLAGDGPERTPEAFLKRNGGELRRVLGGLFAFFRGDAAAGGRAPRAGVALLDAIASLGLAGKAEGDLGAALATYAAAFYAKGQGDQADLCLLGSIVLSAIARVPPPKEAIELAEKHKSRLAWALRFQAELHGPRAAGLPDPAAFAASMREAEGDACETGGAGAPIVVMQAAFDLAAGKRKEARAALDRLLIEAEEKGLGVPRMAYRYEEKTATKAFSVTVELSHGSAFLTGGNTYQMGLGIRSPGEPESSLTAERVPSDTSKAGEEAARTYVYAAALAAVIHLLEGDAARATAAAGRAIGTLTAGVRLGALVIRAEKPAVWGADARALLALAAELAAEAGMPFLAGDLWTVVRQGLPETGAEKALAEVFDPLPAVIAALPDAARGVARAKRALAALGARLPCATGKVELGMYEEPACDAYPLALSLRIADALKKLPRLHRGPDTGPRCGPLKSLDSFLGAADRGRYDPDAFTRAVEALRASDRLYDAAVLLSRHKRETHCSPTLLAAARAMGRAEALGPHLRADLLSAAINCSAAAGGAEVEADVLALDGETRRLADPSRNLEVMLSLADLAAKSDKWSLLTKLAAQPGFVERWMSVHPNAAAAALLLDHAVSAINGSPVAVERTKVSHRLLCETFPPGERADLCAKIKGLRAPGAGTAAERQKAAKEAVRGLVSGATGQGKKKR